MFWQFKSDTLINMGNYFLTNGDKQTNKQDRQVLIS